MVFRTLENQSGNTADIEKTRGRNPMASKVWKKDFSLRRFMVKFPAQFNEGI
jgi:hypothetical protein